MSSAADPVPVDVSVLEDEAPLASLAADMCRGMGASVALYESPAECLDAARLSPPRVLVLDWRLRDQLGAAAFMSVRHRYPQLPVVCWTASHASQLPLMIREDPLTRVVDKSAGMESFEAALRWGLNGGGAVAH